MSVGRRILLALVASTICLGPLAAQNSTLPDAAPAPGGRIAAVTARHGMVVAQEARAARIGMEILRQGGNAVDAAVATGFALAVTYPRAGNIGGGGYMLVHLAGRNIDTAIDYRETAPAATTPGIFLDERGEADPRKSRDSALAIGVPGTVAGLSLAHAKYGSGKFTLAQLIAPAIPLARKGIPIEDDTADSLPRSQARLARWPSTMKIFFADGRVLAPGATLVQHDLADTLTAIARDRTAGVLRGRDRRQDRRSRTRRRRPDDARRSQELPGDRARPDTGPLSRLRRPVDAAVLLGRRDPDRNAQHPGRLPRSCQG